VETQNNNVKTSRSDIQPQMAAIISQNNHQSFPLIVSSPTSIHFFEPCVNCEVHSHHHMYTPTHTYALLNKLVCHTFNTFITYSCTYDTWDPFHMILFRSSILVLPPVTILNKSSLFNSFNK
jgi:hypothetical protein